MEAEILDFTKLHLRIRCSIKAADFFFNGLHQNNKTKHKPAVPTSCIENETAHRGSSSTFFITHLPRQGVALALRKTGRPSSSTRGPAAARGNKVRYEGTVVRHRELEQAASVESVELKIWQKAAAANIK